MALFRRGSRSAATDPHGRSREADEALTQFGFAPLGLSHMTGVLRGAVTDEVCRVLPGAEHSTAGRTLLLVSAAAQQIPLTTVQTLRPGIPPANAAASCLPGMMLYVVTLELVRRYDVAHPDRPFAKLQDTVSAAPGPTLQASYQALSRGTNDDEQELPILRAAAVTMSSAVQAAIRDPHGRSWGGWALVAAVAAMNAQQDQLPEPGRARRRPADQEEGAQAAGFAYRLGKSALAATAVALARPFT
jgi:hypothetical protein